MYFYERLVTGLAAAAIAGAILAILWLAQRF